MPLLNKMINIFKALRMRFSSCSGVAAPQVGMPLLSDEEAEEQLARQRFDATFACSGLVDIEGVRKAIQAHHAKSASLASGLSKDN